MNITIVTTAGTTRKAGRSCATWACPSAPRKGLQMAKLSKIAQAKRLALKPKFKVRAYHRCPICGRSRAFLNKSRCAASASAAAR